MLWFAVWQLTPVRNRRCLMWSNAKEFVCFDYNRAAPSVDGGDVGTSHAHEKKGVVLVCENQPQQLVSPHQAHPRPRKVTASEENRKVNSAKPQIVYQDPCLSLPSDSVCAHSHICRKAWGGSQGCNYHSVQCCAACFPDVQQWMWAWWCNKWVQKVKSCSAYGEKFQIKGECSPFAKNLIHARKSGRRDRVEKGCCYFLTKDTRSTISRFCLDWNYIVLSI